jgi:hypothetical protein
MVLKTGFVCALDATQLLRWSWPLRWASTLALRVVAGSQSHIARLGSSKLQATETWTTT